MKRTPLNRNTPLKRTPIRKRSVKLTSAMKRYNVLKEKFLRDCEGDCCPVMLAIFDQQVPVTDVHHTELRYGDKLTDVSTWLAVSRPGHDWLHSHSNQAREHGWLV